MADLTVLDAYQTDEKSNDTHKCSPFDFFTVHYEGYVGNSDKKVFDSRLNVNEVGKPERFQQGRYQVVKCWDMSVFMMSRGETIEIYCPSFYAFGGQSTYSHFDSE